MILVIMIKRDWSWLTNIIRANQSTTNSWRNVRLNEMNWLNKSTNIEVHKEAIFFMHVFKNLVHIKTLT